MSETQANPHTGTSSKKSVVLVCGVLLLGTARCRDAGPAQSQNNQPTLRVGVGQASAGSADAGLHAFFQNLSTEGLARVAETGRPEARLAEGWTIATNGLS